jgi:hypothetical protein
MVPQRHGNILLERKASDFRLWASGRRGVFVMKEIRVSRTNCRNALIHNPGGMFCRLF